MTTSNAAIGYSATYPGLKAQLKEVRLQSKAGLWLSSADAANGPAIQSYWAALPSLDADMSQLSLVWRDGARTWPLIAAHYVTLFRDQTPQGAAGLLNVALVKVLLSPNIWPLAAESGFVPWPRAAAAKLLDEVMHSITTIALDDTGADTPQGTAADSPSQHRSLVEATAPDNMPPDYVPRDNIPPDAPPEDPYSKYWDSSDSDMVMPDFGNFSMFFQTFMSGSKGVIQVMMDQLGNAQVHASGSFYPARWIDTAIHLLMIRSRMPTWMTYRVVGTGRAQEELMNVSLSYTAMDIMKVGDLPLTNDEWTTLNGPTLPGVMQVPLLVGAVGVFHNVPVPGSRLQLSACLLGALLGANITSWADARLAAFNAWMLPNPHLQPLNLTVFTYSTACTPGQPCIKQYSASVLVQQYIRRQCPGMTFMLPYVDDSNSLVTGGPSVTSTYKGRPIISPFDMQAAIQGTPGSLGYLEPYLWRDTGLEPVALQTAAGDVLNLHQADLNIPLNAALNASLLPLNVTADFSNVSLVAVNATGAWPLAFLSYAYCYRDLSASGRLGTLLVAMLSFMMGDEMQRSLVSFGYTALPASLVDSYSSQVQQLAILNPEAPSWPYELGGGSDVGLDPFSFSDNRFDWNTILITVLRSQVASLREKFDADVPSNIRLVSPPSLALLGGAAFATLQDWASPPVNFDFDTTSSSAAAASLFLSNAASSASAYIPASNRMDQAGSSGSGGGGGGGVAPPQLILNDMPLSLEGWATMTQAGKQVVQVPWMIQPVVLLYAGTSGLRLSPCTLAALMNGTYTKWQDLPAKERPPSAYPAYPIKIMACQEDAGNVAALRQYLVKACPGSGDTGMGGMGAAMLVGVGSESGGVGKAAQVGGRQLRAMPGNGTAMNASLANSSWSASDPLLRALQLVPASSWALANMVLAAPFYSSLALLSGSAVNVFVSTMPKAASSMSTVLLRSVASTLAAANSTVYQDWGWVGYNPLMQSVNGSTMSSARGLPPIWRYNFSSRAFVNALDDAIDFPLMAGLPSLPTEDWSAFSLALFDPHNRGMYPLLRCEWAVLGADLRTLGSRAGALAGALQYVMTTMQQQIGMVSLAESGLAQATSPAAAQSSASIVSPIIISPNTSLPSSDTNFTSLRAAPRVAPMLGGAMYRTVPPGFTGLSSYVQDRLSSWVMPYLMLPAGGSVWGISNGEVQSTSPGSGAFVSSRFMAVENLAAEVSILRGRVIILEMLAGANEAAAAASAAQAASTQGQLNSMNSSIKRVETIASVALVITIILAVVALILGALALSKLSRNLALMHAGYRKDAQATVTTTSFAV